MSETAQETDVELAERVVDDPVAVVAELRAQLDQLRQENEDLRGKYNHELNVRFKRGEPVVTQLIDVLDVYAANAEQGHPDAVRIISSLFQTLDRCRAAVSRSPAGRIALPAGVDPRQLRQHD